jgi:ActR/RegA family two-component response regulator
MVLRVLLVDDDAAILKVVKRTLAGTDYEITTAISFSEALTLTGKFGVGVFDFELGDGNGIDLAEPMMTARQVEQVCFLTSSADEGAIAKATLLGPVFAKGDLAGLKMYLAQAAAARL